MYGFHGTAPDNIQHVLKNGLLPAGHPLIPHTVRSTDKGYFGAGNTGVYVAAKLDYALQYSNNLRPLAPGESVRLICVKMKPGIPYHCPRKIGAEMTVKSGHHSHRSINDQEYWLPYAYQSYPFAILTVTAIERSNAAISMNDGDGM